MTLLMVAVGVRPVASRCPTGRDRALTVLILRCLWPIYIIYNMAHAAQNCSGIGLCNSIQLLELMRDFF